MTAVQWIYLIAHPGYGKLEAEEEAGRRDRELFSRYGQVMLHAKRTGGLVMLVDPFQEGLVAISSPGGKTKTVKLIDWTPITKETRFSKRLEALKRFGEKTLGNRFLAVDNTLADADPDDMLWRELKPRVKRFLSSHELAPKIRIVGVGEQLENCVEREADILSLGIRNLKPEVKDIKRVFLARAGKFHNAKGAFELRDRQRVIGRTRIRGRRPPRKTPTQAFPRRPGGHFLIS